MTEKQFGFYSYMAANRLPTMNEDGSLINRAAIYKTPNGDEVLITAVGSQDTPKEIGYMWCDAVLIGEVTEFVRVVP